RRVVVLDYADRAVARVRAAEDADERVVVALADRVELVIVAASAGHRQAEDRLERHVHLLVGEVHLELARIALVVDLRTNREEAGRNLSLGLLSVVLRRQ